MEHQEVYKETGAPGGVPRARTTGGSRIVVALCIFNLHFSVSIYLALPPTLFFNYDARRGTFPFTRTANGSTVSNKDRSLVKAAGRST